ncbi:MAG: hypothetical protein AAF098_12495 [Pseudomonadota bacterium]
MRSLYLVGVASMMLAESASAQPTQTFCFFQGGFSEGAFVTGTFSGVDSQDLAGNPAPSDGFLLQGELTDFSASFSGNSLVPAISFVLSDLAGFLYEADGGTLGEQSSSEAEGIRASSGGTIFETGIAVAICDGSASCGELISGGSIVDSSAAIVSISTTAPCSPALTGGGSSAGAPRAVPLFSAPLILILSGLVASLALSSKRLWRRSP